MSANSQASLEDKWLLDWHSCVGSRRCTDLSKFGLTKILQLLLLAPLRVVFAAGHLHQSQEAGAVTGSSFLPHPRHVPSSPPLLSGLSGEI